MAFALDTLTMHGIGRAFGPESRRMKIFWTAMVLLCFSFAAYGTKRIIQEFLEYRVVLSIKTEFRDSMPLPAVTICNGLRMYDSNHKSSFSKGSDQYINVANRYCTFGNKRCSPMPQKDSLSPEPFCVAVNLNQTMSQIEPVVLMGIQFEFFLNISDKIETKFSILDPPVEAVKIYLHSKGLYPILVDNDLIAKPGHMTKIVLRKNRLERLPSPYHSNCINRGSKKTVDFFPGDYSFNGCRFSRRARDTFKKCGVVMFALKKYFPFDEFENKTEDRECFENMTTDLDDLDQDFGGHCQPLCKEQVYEVESVTEVKWPIGSEMRRMKDIAKRAFGFVPSDDYILSNFGRIVIGYNKFEEKVVEEIGKQTPESLVSYVGGLLGIFLGCSLISVAEIFVAGISFLIAKSKNENYSMKETERKI